LNVSTLLTHVSAAHGDQTALRFGSRRLSYRELDVEVNRFAGALLGRGYEPGDRVALFTGNSIEYVIAMFGTFRAGLTVVPINAKLSRSEVQYIVDHARVRVIVVDEAHADTAADGAAADSVDVVIHVDGDPGAGVAFARFLEGGSPELSPRNADVDPTDTAWLFYTSGTTGRPKGAQLSHRNLLAMNMSTLADVYRFQRHDVVLHCAPLSHGSGLYLLASIAAASDNIIYDEPSFSPDRVLEMIERERITAIAFVAPTMIVMLLGSASQADTSSLRAVIYGGGPIHVEHAQAMLDRFGPVFVQIYGQGESPMTITCLPADAHDRDDPKSLSSAGYIRSNIEVRVVDADGVEVPVGTDGEVAVRGDVVMAGYLDNPEATERSLRGGWLHTGDIGSFDGHGRLHLHDRTNDVIISGGTNIYPREVEEVLVQHDAVREAIVWGVKDEVWGERVVAGVVVEDGAAAPDQDELIAFCKERIASFKKPSEVHVVDELPKNAYGKVLRREMRERFAAAKS
jgi:long-chain acyl-CoA synthetase